MPESSKITEASADKTTPAKTTTFEGPAAMASAPKPSPELGTARFVPTALLIEGYIGSRLRRLEKYQAYAMRLALAKFQITSVDQIADRIKDVAVRKLACNFLSSCMVGPERVVTDPYDNPRVARLLRKAEAGERQLFSDLSDEQLATLIGKVIDQAKVFESKSS